MGVRTNLVSNGAIRAKLAFWLFGKEGSHQAYTAGTADEAEQSSRADTAEQKQAQQGPAAVVVVMVVPSYCRYSRDWLMSQQALGSKPLEDALMAEVGMTIADIRVRLLFRSIVFNFLF